MTSSSSSSSPPSSWLPISWTTTKLPPDESNPDSPKTRISLTVPPRLLVLPPAIFLLASTIGFVRGSRAASLRFLAENAHRPPRTVQGWYFYQKTKNYRVAFAGLKGAGKEGLRGIAVGCAWVTVEHYWGEVLGGGQVLGGYPLIGELARNSDEVAAGVTTSAVVSAIYRLGWRTGARTVALGAFIGGTLQVLMGMRRALEKEVAARKAVLDSSPNADSAATTPSS
ncbi:hypothetical protein BDZ89DRAFT_1007864 [Hymenopellis radicata]|nr:hypothetical protein BDZ89DRAFT_1007864 [Hymenopellis radicata]